MAADTQDITIKNMQRSIPLTKGMSLYHALQKEGIALSAPCAGNGTCGACKVKVVSGILAVTEKDRELLSEAELKEGWRLACQVYPEEACEIYVPEEQFAAVTGYCKNNGQAEALMTRAATQEDVRTKDASGPCAIAIDLGTTTIAYELFSLKTGETIKTISSVNPQRIYGADVVSRMEQSDNGRRDMLRLAIRQGIKKDLAVLLKGVDAEYLQSVAISGNTAMVHLLMGYSCEGLGRYPFTPVTLEHILTDAVRLNIMEQPVPVHIMAGISAYVGGDILTGLVSRHFLSEEQPCLFLDLGTNAEMALTDGHGKIYVTSAPAGPAFEAANISCGVGSVEGAISGLTIQNGQQLLTTIGEREPVGSDSNGAISIKKEPVGFCGSGILEAVYELLKNNLIDETGLLADAYFDGGYPVGKLKITQQDIRQIQLAKSAVFSAIHILLKKAGIAASRIEKVYLAGGFGYNLNVEKAIGIGLLPQDFTGKVQAVGNTSLYGAKEILRGRITEAELQNTKAACEEIYLSNETDFQAVFMENMNFEKLDECGRTV